MLTARKIRRDNDIIAVCSQLRSDSLSTPNGLDINNYRDDDLYEIVMSCCSFDNLSGSEKRLAVVAFVEGAAIAKKSIWYA